MGCRKSSSTSSWPPEELETYKPLTPDGIHLVEGALGLCASRESTYQLRKEAKAIVSVDDDEEALIVLQSAPNKSSKGMATASTVF